MDLTPPPVDLSVLAGQSGGDADLEREVLALFAERVPADLEHIKAVSGAEQRAAAHRIVGSARAIGAGEVARLARAVERGEGDAAALEAAIAKATEFIARYLAG
jgi:HPt (histidine-containing phosphotransfer) domain-containing protein